MDLVTPVGPDDHADGPADTPVTLVEYGDFQCPSCGQAYPIVKAIQKALGPRLRFVFRHLPLTDSHPYAALAAEAAEAAGAQGRFWPMHDLLFERQRQLGPDMVMALVRELGLDAKTFENDLQTGRFRERVERDVKSAIESGARGTPTFFINGARHQDRWDEATLTAALERTAGRSRAAR